MSPLEELHSGELGEAFVALLYRQVLTVGVRYRFPAPEGYAGWSVDAAIDQAHTYLADTSNYPRLTELAAKVADDAGLERMLGVMIRNYMRASGRRTVIGKLIRRLRHLLGEDARFVVVAEQTPGAGNYALAGGRTEQFNGDPYILRAAAAAVREVSVVRWSASARREGPVADATTLTALCAAVLEAADGSLPLTDLAEVVGGRLGLDPRTVPGALPVEDIDDLAGRDDYTEPADVSASSPNAATGVLGRAVEDDEVAAAVLEELNDKEKLVMSWLHLPVRDIAKHTGLPVSTTGNVSQRVRDKLTARLRDMDEGSQERIAFAVRDGARAYYGLDPA